MAHRFIGMAIAGAVFGAMAGCDASTQVTRTTYLNREPDQACVIEAVRQFAEADPAVVAFPGNIPEDIGYGVQRGTGWPLSVSLEIRAEGDGPHLFQSYREPATSMSAAADIQRAMASVESAVLAACGVTSSRVSEQRVRR
jgi:hypothetical protein